MIYTFAGIGSIQALVPPQMTTIIKMLLGQWLKNLWLNLALTFFSLASGQAPFSIANIKEALSASFLKP